jgi:hypothetical protein
MPKKIHPPGYQVPVSQTRHVRWSWEESPERGPDSEPFVRYHFIIVDDKDRGGTMNRCLAGLSQYGELIPRRSVEGKVSGTKFRYLFKSYDCSIKPEMLKLYKLGKLVIMDPNLRERKVGNIEDYVERVYTGR